MSTSSCPLNNRNIKEKKNKKEKKRHYKVYSNLTVERTGHNNEVVEIKNDTGYLKTLQDKQFGL
jgi:hypothetical protein